MLKAEVEEVLKIARDLKLRLRAYEPRKRPCMAPVRESARSRWKLTCEGAESGLHPLEQAASIVEIK